MSKVSEAQKRAVRKYDSTKRKKVPVGCRLDPDQVEKLDQLRGDMSRSALVETLLLEWIGSRNL